MDFGEIDLNSLPVWVVAIAIVLYLLPKILERLAPFVPPLASLMKADQERKDTALHWKLESNGLRLGEELKSQDRMLDILENSLERMWDDRVSSEANYQAIRDEVKRLHFQVVRMSDIISVHGANIAGLADEVEEFKNRLGQVPERIDSLGAYIEGEKG